MEELIPVKNALISVYDKNGLEPLCRALKAQHVQIFSTGGTASAIEKFLGGPPKTVESVTQFPEMMDGRVKTLHPRIFGGILARRDQKEDVEAARRLEIPLFDLIIVNLYPFWEHRGKRREEQVSFIDIGGPAMLRAASKNYAAVTVLSDPSDYSEFINELEAHGGKTGLEFRHQLAARTFRRTSHYDDMIASEWEKTTLPTSVSLVPQTPLRYGENPHQRAVWAGPQPAPWRVLQGKELSYNNILDAEAALRVVQDFSVPCVTIIKHNNPCGVAAGADSPAMLFANALAGDDKSAFGGIVAINRPLDAKAAEAISAIFMEVVIAPAFDPAALEILGQKKNLRLIEWPKPHTNGFEIRTALGGWLVQDTDVRTTPNVEFTSVTSTPLPRDAISDLKFAWIVCKHVRSNAIVIAQGGRTLGIGAGQMSRVDAIQIALQKAGGKSLQGAVLASDAFFPFRDNIDALKGTGIRAVIQPGGSQRDAEVIQACNDNGISMVFTRERHFRH